MSSSLSSYYHVIFVAVISLITTTVMNLIADNKLKEAANSVNKKPVERYTFGKKRGGFQLVTWQDLRPGDVIKI